MYKNMFCVFIFNDFYYLCIGNIFLCLEKVCEYNIGVIWNGKLFLFIDFFFIIFDGYYNEVIDKIVVFFSIYVWKM